MKLPLGEDALCLDVGVTDGITRRQPAPRLSVARRQALVAGYQAGATIRQVAAEHGVNRDTVMRALAAEGVEARRFVWDKDSIQVVVQLRRQGLSLRHIAAQLGAESHTLSRSLKRLGYADLAKRRQTATDEQLGAAVRLYKKGLSVAQVAARVGITSGVVRRAITKAGVPMRDSQGRTKT